jgi:hypothetical protein
VSIYEVLVFAALACAGGFAYYLYRADTRARPPGANANADSTEVTTDRLMFGRAPQDRNNGGTKPGAP